MRVLVPLPAPDSWRRLPAKFVLDRHRRDVRDEDQIVTAFRDGEVTLRQNRRTEGFTNALQEIGYHGIRSGDLVIHSMDGFAGAIGVSDSDGKASPVVHTYTGRGAEPRFYAYYLRTVAHHGFVAALGKGIRERSTAFDPATLGSLVVPVPRVAEQRAIADFLDRETGRIDALVEKKRRLIDLLEEKRTALISHVVTKGLDPTVPMKDSGIPWLGEIPAHWEVKPLMHLAPPKRKIMYGIVLPGPNVEEGIPIIKSGDVKPGRLDPGALARTTREIESRYVRSRVFPGDIVYSIRGSVGSAEIVPDSLQMANLTQDAARVAPALDIDRHWLLYALRASILFQQLESGMWGAAVKGVNIKDLKRLLVPKPPPQEQEEIGLHLDTAATRIDALEQRVAKQLDLLAEYRQALITAAVTGQIDPNRRVPGSTAGDAS